MTRSIRLAMCVVAASLGACAGPPEGAQPLTQAATSMNGVSLNGISLNGISLNGISLNGISLNGISLNGISLNGISLNGISLNGISLNGVSLNGTSLNGTSLNGVSLNGISLNGVSLNGVLSDGRTIPLHVDSIVQGAGNDGDIFYYAVSFETDQGSFPLCGNEQDGSPVLSIPLAGTWDERQGVPGGGSHIADPSVITFACLHHALAKCVQWGYKPWKSVNGVSLADYHQACTRMVRADYCGDGVSWTKDGTLIDFYDGLSIQTDNEPRWRFEAEFTPAGATCLTKERVKHIKTVDGRNPDRCILDREDRDGRCGDREHFADGTLVMVRDPKNDKQADSATSLLPY